MYEDPGGPELTEKERRMRAQDAITELAATADWQQERTALSNNPYRRVYSSLRAAYATLKAHGEQVGLKTVTQGIRTLLSASVTEGEAAVVLSLLAEQQMAIVEVFAADGKVRASLNQGAHVNDLERGRKRLAHRFRNDRPSEGEIPPPTYEVPTWIKAFKEATGLA